MAAEPYLRDTDATLYLGDCLDVLRELPDRSVHMCCTSPPFYGLRDYGTGAWEGGDEGCDHKPPSDPKLHISRHGRLGIQNTNWDNRHGAFHDTCGKCGATRIDRQIGLEASPDEWVARLVEVFREVRRVLRDDGTLWVELGDSYAGGGGGNYGDSKSTLTHRTHLTNVRNREAWLTSASVKQKDLLGQPWLLAFALRADGWYLRSEIIWHRPNPMPESVTDRPTKAHSTVFLLSKKPRYYFDSEAIREPHAQPWRANLPTDTSGGIETEQLRKGSDGMSRGAFAVNGRNYNPNGANARSVWTIPTEPTPFKHFATWPQKLCQRMILAGTSERGVCPECGAPWVREVERGEVENVGHTNKRPPASTSASTQVFPSGAPGDRAAIMAAGGFIPGHARRKSTLGWRRSCDHDAEPIPATVLDVFAGSGTTLLVARNLGRRSVGIELSGEYCALATHRLQQLSLLAL